MGLTGPKNNARCSPRSGLRCGPGAHTHTHMQHAHTRNTHAYTTHKHAYVTHTSRHTSMCVRVCACVHMRVLHVCMPVCACYMCVHVCYVCVCASVLQLSDLSQVGSECTKCQLGALLTEFSGQRKNHKCAHCTWLNGDRRSRFGVSPEAARQSGQRGPHGRAQKPQLTHPQGWCGKRGVGRSWGWGRNGERMNRGHQGAKR